MRNLALLVLVAGLALGDAPPRYRVGSGSARVNRCTLHPTATGCPRATASAEALVDFVIAPPNGLGMPSACSTTAPVTATDGGAVTFSRASVAECPSNDGQAFTQVSSGVARVSSGAVDSTVVGIWQERAQQFDLLWVRDMSNAAWVKSNMTCTKTATGMRNDSNGASTCTASANNGTALQTITRASAAHATTVRIKRRTGTGTVSVTVDNGSNWLDITSSLSSSLWKWVVPAELPGCTALVGSICIVNSGLSVTSANPTIGIRLGTSGDAVDLDFWSNEAHSSGTATTPMEVGGTPVTRAVELPDVAMSPTLTSGYCASSTTIAQVVSLKRYRGVPGNGTPGNSTGSASYDDSYQSASLIAETSATSPVSSTTGVTTATPINRWTSFYDASKLNGCINGVCGSGTSATYSAPTWTRFRLAGYDATNGPINGVIKEVQLDRSGTACRRTLNVVSGTLGAVGDSITAGPAVGVTGWPSGVNVLRGTITNNFAVSGAQVAAISTQFEQKVRGRYAIVGVLGGINDLNAGTAAATIFTSLQSIYDNARTSGMRVVAITVLPASGQGTWSGAKQTQLEALNTLITAYCASNSITCVDAYNSSLRNGTALAPAYDSGDGLHPNQAGEDYLASLVSAAL